MASRLLRSFGSSGSLYLTQLRITTASARPSGAPLRASFSCRHLSSTPEAISPSSQTLLDKYPIAESISYETEEVSATNGQISASLYAALKVGDMSKAERFFATMTMTQPLKLPQIYNAMIEGYANSCSPREAHGIFTQMLTNGVRPNKVTFIFLARALIRFEPKTSKPEDPQLYKDMLFKLFDQMHQEKVPLSLVLKHPDLTGAEMIKLDELIDEYCTRNEVGKDEGAPDPKIFQELMPEEIKAEKLTNMESVKLARSVDTSGMEDMRTVLEIMTNPNMNLRTKQEELEISAGLIAKRRLSQLIYEGKVPQTITNEKVTDIIDTWRATLLPIVQKEVDQCKKMKIGMTNRHLYGPFILLLPPEDLIEITILEVLSNYNSQPAAAHGTGVWGGAKTTKLVIGIGNAIEQTVNAREIKKRKKLLNLAPGRFEHVLNSPRLFNSTLRQLAAKLEMSAENDFGLWTPHWPSETKAKLGSFLLQALVENAKLTIDSPQGPKLVDAFYHAYNFHLTKRVGVIKFNELLGKMLARSANINIQGRMLPMLVPPRPWITYKSGGYLTIDRSILRTKEDCKEQADAIKEASQNHQLDDVLSALDVLGQTPWRINTRVLDYQLQIWDQGGGRGGIPSLDDAPTPPKPDNFDTLPPAEKRKFVVEKNKITKTNKEMHSLRCDVNYKLEIANAFRGYTMYFPHNIDFRGRAYPIPPHLNHVGSDQCRGLLLFDEAKPLGERGLWWLKVHMANLLGADKLSFDGRLKFVEERLEKIFAVADDPMKNDWWLQLDDCWQFLATCFELTSALRSPNPLTYMSRLPIHQDGSCNGLQHYAALGGDIDGATSVNLLDSEIPQDVYSRVAQSVTRLIDEDSSNPKSRDYTVANLVKGKVDRKVVKQTVMTNVYGVTFIGARMQIANRLKDRGDISEDESYHCSVYIARKVFESLERMFTGAREIQFWLTNAAREIASSRPLTNAEISSEETNIVRRQAMFFRQAEAEVVEGEISEKEEEERLSSAKYDLSQYEDEDEDEEMEEDEDEEDREEGGRRDDKEIQLEVEKFMEHKPIERKATKKSKIEKRKKILSGNTNVRWTSPLGLPIVQPYRKFTGKQIFTSLQTVQIQVTASDSVSNVPRQKSAFPPNFIHSLDSTHMLMTALACQMNPERITFASVHDSYWTHASTVDQMNQIIREEFVKLHSKPIMENLRNEFLERYRHHIIYERKTRFQSRPPYIPPVPQRGNFDIKNVLKSKYFFD